MPFLHRPGCDLYYEVTGAGPAVVFAHGFGGNHLAWWQQVPHLAERYTCVTFSHRGFGPSREDAGGPGPAAFVDDLGALLDRLGVSNVRLVAQSMGGWTCLGYALRAPGKVRSLVMASTFGSLAAPELDALLVARRASARGDQTSGVHPAAGERMAREQPALHFLYREIEALNGVDRAAVLSGLIALRTTPPAALAVLSMPVLCVVGEEDAVIPPDSVAILASRIPGARLVRVPAAGHSVYFERADVFNRLLDDFLSEDGRP
jgi:pimeloyl-ACP methyl ester carboxylesterase